MAIKEYILLGRITAIVSLLIGILYTWVNYYTYHMGLLIICAYLVWFIIIVNIIVLISTLIKARKNKENRKKLYRTSKLVLVVIFMLFGLFILTD